MTLPNDLTIYTVAQTRTAWLAAGIEDPAAEIWAVDAGAVDEIDGAGVQLLLALQRSATEAGAVLQLRHPSTALVRACRLLGATPLLDTDTGTTA